jgi:hypothetical protein
MSSRNVEDDASHAASASPLEFALRRFTTACIGRRRFEGCTLALSGIGPGNGFLLPTTISTFASKKAALELTIVHADTPTLLSNLASNDAAA